MRFASYSWEVWRNGKLIALGWRMDTRDRSVFHKVGPSGERAWLLARVDDFFYFGTVEDVAALRAEVAEAIPMKLIEPRWINATTYSLDFVGIDFQHDMSSGVVRLSLHEYMRKVIKRFGLTGPRRSTPMDQVVPKNKSQHPLYKAAIAETVSKS